MYVLHSVAQQRILSLLTSLQFRLQISYASLQFHNSSLSSLLFHMTSLHVRHDCLTSLQFSLYSSQSCKQCLCGTSRLILSVGYSSWRSKTRMHTKHCIDSDLASCSTPCHSIPLLTPVLQTMGKGRGIEKGLGLVGFQRDTDLG
ncbi:hypothetical protein Pmani_002222 [Petrolisthes manimaculis]|uniref:Uncharacterized protein n=1 Tax=Petrolisthes manimaculis TaxID=1843537 RepID=A0AAE1QIZ6_9EUCA|nr:hypothetical protein Pmani_028263 [Petrolisthes manimaculis]KAK4327281.1 hypothetical protein Pmani_002222 [Petrolisthes manimaculis]